MKLSKSNDHSLFRCAYNLPFDEMTRLQLYRTSKGNLDLIQRMGLLKRLPVHSGCVNTICWNESGEHLLSGSDDQHLIITNGFTYKIVEDYKTTHKANIFSAKFLPCTRDSRIVSCSGDGMILFTDLMCKDDPVYKPFNCHCGTAYELATIPLDPNSFLSCGEDGTVRWFDLRIKDHCNRSNCHEDVMISCQRAVTALSVNATAPYQLAIGCSDSTVRLFDRRMLGTKASGMIHKSVPPLCTFTVPSFKRPYRISSLCFSPDGEEVLVSYSSNDLYLFSIKDQEKTHLNTGLSSQKKSKSFYRIKDSSPTPVRRLRLRGDWSDTGPDARPERESVRRGEIAQARPTLHTPLMRHLTNVISRLLNDPATRAALNGGGEDSLDTVDVSQPQSLNSCPPAASSSSGAASNSQEPISASAIDTGATPDSILTNCSPAIGLESSVEASEARHVGFQLENNGSEVAPEIDAPCMHSSAVLSARDSKDFAKPSSSADVHMVPPHYDESVPSCSKENNSELAFNKEASVSSCSENFSNLDAECKPKERATGEVKGECSAEALTAQASSDISATKSETRCLFAETGIHQSDLNTLQSHLVGVREGYIGRHGMEPDVRLSYSQLGSSSSRISLRSEEVVAHDGVVPSISGNSQKEVHALSDRNRPVSHQLPSLNDAEPGPSQNLTSSDSISDGGSILSDDCDSIEEELKDVKGKNKSRYHRRRSSSESGDDGMTAAPEIKQKYTGHRNARTMIKEATFWGSNYVMSGSDCGHVFVWERIGGRLVMLLEADAHVVNCLQPHPSQPLLATSGIDHDVKLWAPVGNEPFFDLRKADEIMRRNALMLEETKDTITVPASFMIRMVACLNQIRRGGRTRSRRRPQDSPDD